MENRVSLSQSHFENNGAGDSNREQSSKRRKILEQKKVIDQLIDVACAQKDHLSPFPSFRHFNCGGLSLYLQSGHGDKLSYSVKKYIQNLLKINMEGPYGSQWPMEEKVKHREMVSTQAHYIFVHEASNANVNGMFSKSDAEKTTTALNKKDPMVAFVHFRFIIEEMIPVLYVYELQIEPRFQGRGLGTFLMELIELIACKNCMGAVVFTVQKANSKALNFYQSKLRYTISSISPSRVNLLMTIETSYEILCKAFNEEAKAVLERC
ncbi:N-alpha-acetyltransferase 40 isoform X2 [Benincasa hispida]|uniref:N-alpha-acetyltransferase 40 isoform X2 n=1 Tax=Benincasa hispida TaxID=102211 RepID=UPI001902BFF9|nr:N-alpha-acetyltransferase 40 isoform X2 [Benincasa hispida]XP_038894905.1 N-alpha-acetyltransferase 40 isoform X2 [Benincasa hispida]XP_038894906.1 N-alpha-acetyltransferase 40 isoform X2 [Benincasa hispida]XP_038894907.1 N-alpha-acetyltransferase 40 isoform X2 [Benincasa hispida]